MEALEVVIADWTEWAGVSGYSNPHRRIERLGVPHRPTPLPAGWQGVYCFRWGSRWLKVGKAGPKSAARWLSHHYGALRADSTLAFCLLRYGRIAECEDPSLPGLRNALRRVDPDEIGDWIKKNTERANLLIGSETGKAGLAELESIAHRVLEPVFEGPWQFGGAL